MKLVYSVSIEDFRALQPPFASSKSQKAGFKVLLGFCGLLAALGVFTLLQGFGAPVGSFLIGLALAGAVAGYFYDQHSRKRSKQQYERNITLGYQKVHCRKQRVLEFASDNFTASCQCGTVTRPWSEMTHMSENEKFFLLGTKTGPIIVPKSAFASEAERTEFRALLSGNLNRGQSALDRSFEFACVPEDYRRARRLHNRQAGGWRFLLRKVAALVLAVVCVGAFAKTMIESGNAGVACALIAAVLAGPLLRMRIQRRKHYFGRLEIRFNDQDLFLKDLQSEARQKWEHYIGYLADGHVLLLYINPRLYRIIPQRAMATNGREFKAMVESKLPKYDYHNPVPVQEPEAAITSQPVS